jgi:hypothetical protein
MSVYSTPVSQLKTSDLVELLQERAVENLRLEFKRESPDKDETLKKLSSFANTHGGLVVIGAIAQSKDGRIEALPGVDVISGYTQKVVDWCFKECYPPINVTVSAPIPTPNNDGKVCYVIVIEESDIAPHFLNGRNGIWIRTNEFSGKYDFALADETEIRHLLHRRQLTLDRRRNIVERARRRFETYASTIPNNPNPNDKVSVLELSIVPRFPARQVCKQEELTKTVKRLHYPTYRSIGFPRFAMGVMTQHESAIIREPIGDLSFFEANVWGMVFYAMRLVEKEYTEHATGVHLYAFVGHLLLFLKHASDVFRAIGLVGPIFVDASLRGIRDGQWVFAKSIAMGIAPIAANKPISVLDESFGLSVATTVEDLREKPDEVVAELLRSIFFSLNWSDLVDTPTKLETLINQGEEYNGSY